MRGELPRTQSELAAAVAGDAAREARAAADTAIATFRRYGHAEWATHDGTDTVEHPFVEEAFSAFAAELVARAETLAAALRSADDAAAVAAANAPLSHVSR